MAILDKRLSYVEERAKSYIHAKIDVPMYEDILEMIKEIRERRAKDK
jgi:hypothetical protein